MSDLTDPAAARDALVEEVSRVLVGNERVVERLTVALLTDGHVLLEGVPGVAKTTITGLFARATGLEYNRIQLTPDTLPADITGTTIYREQTGEFEVKKGPVFGNVVVADEINRATPKTQSALLEAMQERRVTIDGTSYDLPEPFMLVATQNPIEMAGTFELPEAQRDRFQFQLAVDVPERDSERDLLERFDGRPDFGPADIDRVLPPDTLPALRATVSDVHIAPAVREYLLDVVADLREHDLVAHGPSPRAALMLQRAVKASAAIDGREYVVPGDLKRLAAVTLAHRLVLRTGATLDDVDARSVVESVVSTRQPPDIDGFDPDGPVTDGIPGAESSAGGDEAGTDPSGGPATPADAPDAGEGASDDTASPDAPGTSESTDPGGG